jgi:hypothetical protein
VGQYLFAMLRFREAAVVCGGMRRGHGSAHCHHRPLHYRAHGSAHEDRLGVCGHSSRSQGFNYTGEGTYTQYNSYTLDLHTSKPMRDTSQRPATQHNSSAFPESTSG